MPALLRRCDSGREMRRWPASRAFPTHRPTDVIAGQHCVAHDRLRSARLRLGFVMTKLTSPAGENGLPFGLQPRPDAAPVMVPFPRWQRARDRACAALFAGETR